MIYVGIDVAKEKHDCCILGSDGEILFSPFTIQNTLQGFDELYEKIWSLTSDMSEIKVGLEATGHYHLNLLRSLLDNGLPSFVINPLHTNLYRKGQSLRKTKTDKVDAASIAMMLLTDRTLKPYSDTSYHNEELKSLTRYRFDKVQERARLKTSVSRLVNILFPELEKLVPSLHMASVLSSYGISIYPAIRVPWRLFYLCCPSDPTEASPSRCFKRSLWQGYGCIYP